MAGIVRNLFLMLADVVCIILCWLVSVLVYHACGGGYTPSFYLRMCPVIPLWLAVNLLFRLYHGRFFYPAAPFSPMEEMRRLVGSAAFVHLAVIAVLVLMRQTMQDYSRVVIVCSGLLTALFAQPVRDVVRWLLKRLAVGQIPLVLIGDTDELRRIASTLKGSAYLGLDPVGYFSEKADETVPLLWLGDAKEVVVAARRMKARVLLVCEDVRLFRCHMQAFSEWFTHIEYLPRKSAFPVSGSRTVTFDGIGGIELVNQDQMSVLRLEKWLIDKVLSVVALICLMPLLLLLALLVKTTSRGHAFFRHRRLGKGGRAISVWKFRTMYADAEERLSRILAEDPAAAAEWRESFKLRRDPRVTPVGRFLRKTSLDELPQLLNVIGGSMSLVGPRPIVEDEIPYYGSSYAVFSSVRPGITGLWQVSGRSDCNYDERVALDVHYILNWSPWMDFWILLRTVAAVLKMRGSY